MVNRRGPGRGHPPRRLNHQTIGALHTLLKQQHSAILVSWEREGGPGRRLDDPPERETRVNPPSDLVLQTGDTLVVISERPVRL